MESSSQVFHQYKFCRLQDLNVCNFSTMSKVIIPNIIHIVLNQTNEISKIQIIKNFYELAKTEPLLFSTLKNAENCSIIEFNNVVVQFLKNSFLIPHPLVAFMLLYGSVINNSNLNTRAEKNKVEKLVILNNMINNLKSDSTSVLYGLITPSIIKTFLVEMTVACMCATIYGAAYAFTSPLAIPLQIFANWIRLSANDVRTTSQLARKIITTNREKSLLAISNLVNSYVLDGAVKNKINTKEMIENFYRDLEKLKLDLCINNISQNIIISNEAKKIIANIHGKFMNPAEFVILLNRELKLDININKVGLIRKLIILRQVVCDYEFPKDYNNIRSYEHKSLVVAIILIFMRQGIIAPTLRESKTSISTSFVAPENIINSLTTLLPKIAGIYGLIGDAGGSFVNNMFVKTERYPEGYTKVMQMFKNLLLEIWSSIDLTLIDTLNKDIIQTIQTVLDFHTNKYALARRGKTNSRRKFDKLIQKFIE